MSLGPFFFLFARGLSDGRKLFALRQLGQTGRRPAGGEAAAAGIDPGEEARDGGVLFTGQETESGRGTG